ncbi:MAG: efflux RND transporter permease subunit, partial [Bacteroidota bacterium]
MISFLTDRPIAVLSAIFALIVMGLASTLRLPVSLMPDVEIPEITVKVQGQNQSARELEDALLAPLRRELLQVPELQEIESQTRANVGLIKLRLKHGTSVDYTFLEVNEQIDAAMSRLPRNIERPIVIKASSTDLPVFYINMGIKAQVDSSITDQQFLALSEFAENVIRKRLEQLPEIALVDISGRQFSEIQIRPNLNRMQSLGITQEQLGQILEENNINLGSLLVRDGKYQFNIRLSSKLQTAQDIANVYVKSGDKLFQIKDFASVTIAAQERTGAYLSQGRMAIGMAIIKQADARMATLKEKVAKQIRLFERDYPEISFSLSQDQTQLLDYSIDNLVQSLIWGSIFAFIMLFIFLKDPRAPWLIGLTIPLSVMISLSTFYVFNISINIISLSGLVLGVGLMIDNAIIVIDNIVQKLNSGLDVREACIQGTLEVIRPLLSSALTTSAVFLPLIFLSGVSGALFLDQALTVSIGLGSSLLVSITALPTLFRLLYSENKRVNSPKKPSFFMVGYQSLMNLIWKYPIILGMLILGICLAGIYTGSKINIQKLPKLTQSELILELDWNEPLNINAHVSLVK